MSGIRAKSPEPNWTWIIGSGLGAILIAGFMWQLQRPGVKRVDGFEIVSQYEYPSDAHADLKMLNPVSVTPTAAVSIGSVPPAVHEPYEPPADQPAWLLQPTEPQRAQAIQAAWAAHLGWPVELHNRLGQRFRLIPPGIYERGTGPESMAGLLASAPADDAHWRACLASSSPPHRVVISRPFYLAVHETTQAEFKALVDRNPSWYCSSGPEPHYVQQVAGVDTSRHPVEGVSWLDAVEFCTRLSQSDAGQIVWPGGDVPGRSTVLPQYQLPTDAQWEFAARAGGTSNYWFGDLEPQVIGWFGSPNDGRTWNVGHDTANPLGLHEMHSSVWEWVADQWDEGEYRSYRRLPLIDPRYHLDQNLPRVVRGGMWPDRRSRSFDRYAYDNDFQTFFVGFRISFSPLSTAH